MQYEYDFRYLTCQSCNAKIHCEECAQTLSERLEKNSGISKVSFDMPNRRIAIQTEGMNEMDLLDVMEDIGIFAD